jgi:hypothetical protein
MWIFSQYGFYSVVTGNEEVGKIQLRTRDRNHLENLKNAIPELANVAITQTDNADYQYRLIVDKVVWTDIIMPKLSDIDYGNFKSRVEERFGRQAKYSKFLHRLWEAVYETFAD